jgi:tetratricopeptide (TPR) repeat protein
MRRFVSLVLVLLIGSGIVFADAKKTQEKIRKAEAETRRGNFGGAEKLLQKASQEDPDSIEVRDALGGLYSLTRRYSAAAREYSAAVALDDKQHKLNQMQRRRLIDAEGVSYALAGDLEQAKEIYLAALAKDPDYAMYNYNLACVYAEMHDLDSAIPYLKKSWEHRDTLPADIPYPDPRKDDSFKPYWNDPKFQEAVRDIVV